MNRLTSPSAQIPRGIDDSRDGVAASLDMVTPGGPRTVIRVGMAALM
jgi:hypothetical protein